MQLKLYFLVCRGYLTSVILGAAPEGPCAYPPGWRRSTGLKVTGSARDPVDEAAIKLAFLGFPWQYAYYGEYFLTIPKESIHPYKSSVVTSRFYACTF